MGYARAYEMTLHLGLDGAVRDHLAYNLYPPAPASMEAPCIAACALCAAGDHEATIELPFGTLRAGQLVTEITAGQLVDDLRLEAIVAALVDLDASEEAVQ